MVGVISAIVDVDLIIAGHDSVDYQLTVNKSLGYAGQALKSALVLWRSGRVVDGAALEMLCRATYRGFESHLLRN